ncbi:MAG: hypothetical protein EBR01_11530 [Proteobacteria bacterium]|nr:hypothetical protein [Pseudomonadota bacterium]
MPVFGTEVIFNTQQSGREVSEEIISDVMTKLSTDLPTQPRVSLEEALEGATLDLRSSSGVSSMSPRLHKSQLGYFPSNESARLSWHLVVETPSYSGQNKVEAPGSWNYYIDAVDNTILQKFNGNSAGAAQQASGTGSYRGTSIPLSGLDVSNIGNSMYVANTDRLQTFDWTSDSAVTISGPLSNFGTPEGNNAHFFSEKVLDMLNVDFGFNSIDENGFKLISNVNFPGFTENALWLPAQRQAFFAKSGINYFPMSSDLDVVTHEFHHGFTQFHSRLGESASQNTSNILASRSVNESFSDISAIHMKFFSNPATANFLYGATSKRNPNNSSDIRDQIERDLCDPNVDNYLVKTIPGSIGHLSGFPRMVDEAIKQFEQFGDQSVFSAVEHFANGIPNKAFCRLAKRFSSNSDTPLGAANRSGVKKAANLFYMANRSKWTSSTDFYGACNGTIGSLVDLQPQYSSKAEFESDFIHLIKSWQDVGVLPPNPTLSVANNSPTSITLSWANNDLVDAPTMINGYFVFEFRPSENSPRKHMVEGRNNTTFTISSLTPQTQYFFVVVAANNGGSSLDSNVVSVTTPRLSPPNAPSLLTSTVQSSTQVSLAWSDNSSDETSFFVERKIGANGTYSLVAEIPSNTTSYTANSLSLNTAYFFRVRASNAAGPSAYSNEISALLVKPTAASKLTATAAPLKQVNLRWVDAVNETGYEIERANKPTGPFAVIASRPANTTTFSHIAPQADTTYFYRLKALNRVGSSPYSNLVQIKSLR